MEQLWRVVLVGSTCTSSTSWSSWCQVVVAVEAVEAVSLGPSITTRYDKFHCRSPSFNS